jgi:trehalose 6-phosphate phosphatase
MKIENMNEPIHAKTSNQQYAQNLPSAFELIDQQDITTRKPIFFLDFDGTLAPIVSEPDGAELAPQMFDILSQLNKNTFCAIITGRDRADIEKRIAIDNLVYAGSHGYDIIGPNLNWIYEKGKASIPQLDNAQRELNNSIGKIEGIKIERKKFAIAVHYRHVAEENIAELLQKVNAIIDQNDYLKAGPGNKVMELKPNIEWHKGKALTWLMDHFNLSLKKYIPIFLGDDITDEDAFATIAKSGIGIIVGHQLHPTLASHVLKDIDEVGVFLSKINKRVSS